jgi:hypothetical protein
VEEGEVSWRRGKPLEKTIEKKAVLYARSLKLVALKLNILGYRGWPDRMFLGENRCIFFIEFKRPGNVPTELQSQIHKLLKRWGFSIYVVDGTEEAKRVIEKEVRAAQLSA